ncbi:MAG: hypothetical protein RIE53_03840 [Rhodothermales bacterium]
MLLADLKSGKGPAWALADQGFISLANFLSILLLVRSTSDGVFGVFILAWSVLMVLAAVQHAGLTQAHHNLHARFHAHRGRELSGTLVVLQWMLSGGLAVFFLGAGSLAPDAWSTPAFALALAVPFWLGQDLVRRFLYTQHRTGAAFVNDALSYGGQLIGIVMLVQFGSPSAASALLVLGGASAVACLLGAWQLRAHVSFRHLTSHRHAAYLRQTWRFGSWLGGSEILKWTGRHGATWLVAFVSGMAVLGPFRAVLHVVNALNPLKLAAFAYLPTHAAAIHATSGDRALRKWLGGRMIALLLPYGVLATALVLGGNGLLVTFYGTRFDGSFYAGLLALGVASHAIHFIRSLVQLGLVAQRRTRLVMIESMISVGLMATVGLGLLMWLGLPGVLMGEIVTGVLLLCLNVYFLFRAAGDVRTTGGHEADIELRRGSRTVLKRHHDREEAAREFSRLSSLRTLSEASGNSFSVPRALSLDAAAGHITMTLEPGAQLQELLETDRQTSPFASGHALGRSLGAVRSASGHSVTLPDFGAHNALWDTSTSRLTLIDFGQGQAEAMPTGEAAHVLAHVAIRLAHPRRVFSRTLWTRYTEFLRATMDGLEHEVDTDDAAQALRKVRHDVTLGPWLRRQWMRRVAPWALARLLNQLEA